MAVATSEAAPPKCFVSHSSADKARFVESFATRLRTSGVDAWFDKWELRVGDSLISRIFDEGIGQADFVAVIISADSMGSKWVREELDVSKVREIDGLVRLLPIILDGLPPPIALAAKRYIKIADPTSYDAEFDEVLDSIFNRVIAPPLGRAPGYTEFSLPGLNHTDAVVLAAICEWALAHGQVALPGSGPIYSFATEHQVDEAAVCLSRWRRSSTSG
jgi:hypothetical protein